MKIQSSRILNDRPHPGPLPRERENSSRSLSGICGWISRTVCRKSRNAHLLFPLPGERVRVRASVTADHDIKRNIPGCDGSANDIRDIKPPMAIPNGWEWLWWTLGTLAVLAILYLAWRFWQKRRRKFPMEPPVPAHVRAKQKLEEALALISQPKPFCILVSDTIRTYLEERFDFRAPERTTEEFLHELQAHGFAGAGAEGKPGRISGELRPREIRQIRTGRTGIARTARFGRAAGRRNRTERSPQSTSPQSTVEIGVHMTFAHPYFLLLLLLLPLLAWLKGRRGRPPAFLVFVGAAGGRLDRMRRRSRAGAFLAALRWLVLALFIIALAQPRLMKSQTTVKASGIDIVVALDLSGSMISEDFVVRGQRVNRFNMARSVLKGFIDKRPERPHRAGRVRGAGVHRRAA